MKKKVFFQKILLSILAISCTTQTIIPATVNLDELRNYFTRLKRSVTCFRQGTPCRPEDKATLYKTAAGIIIALGITAYTKRGAIRQLIFRKGSAPEYRELQRLVKVEKDYRKTLQKLTDKIAYYENLLTTVTSGQAMLDYKAQLQQAINQALWSAVNAQDLISVQNLLAKNANVNYRDTKFNEQHILWAAISYIITTLENQPAKLNTAIGIAKELIDNGANINDWVTPPNIVVGPAEPSRIIDNLKHYPLVKKALDI